jgi:hypothetical protein
MDERMPVELWKEIFDWLAVAFVGLTFIVGAGALITGKIISDRQEEKIREFDKKLTDAKEHAANLELEAVSLRKELISQGSRVNLLYGKTAETFISELKPFASQRVEIRYSGVSFNQYHIDADTMGVAMRLQYLLGQAGWDVAPLLTDNSNGAAIWVAISSKAPESTTKAARCLLDSLRSVPLKVNDQPIISDALRPPQSQIFSQDGKKIELRPLTSDTIVVTVLAHP